MINITKYLFPEEGTARESLQLIDGIAIPNMAIFVINKQGTLMGSLTDGDIRRGLLAGKSIDETVSIFMNTSCKYIVEGENNFENVEIFRALGVRILPVVDAEIKILKLIDIENLRSVIPVDVILMAGGRGERLKPLTDDIPKPMLKIGENPIIITNILRLMKYGITKFHVSVRYLAEKIIDGIDRYNFQEANFNYLKEDAPLGTIGSVKLIKSFVNDTVILMNSDLLTNIDFQDFYQNFLNSNADMQVATIPYPINVPYAVMDISDNAEVVSFKEKPRFTYYSNAGIYIFKKELIDLIPKEQAIDATHFMETVLANKKKLVSYPILGYWLDVGKHEDNEKAQEDIKHIKL